MIDFNKLQPLIKGVARSTSSRFPTHDIEDVEQAIAVWVYENTNTVQSMLNGEAWEAKLRSLMTRAANSHLKKEDAATYGYSPDDVFEYTTTVVEALLESVFSYEDWQSFGLHGDGQPRAKGQVNETGDMAAMLVDVKWAVEKLTQKQYNAIVWYYKYHWTLEMIGEEEGVSLQAIADRLSKAKRAIQESLGTLPYSELRRGFDGRRLAMGNAEANAITVRDYEG